MLTWRAYLDWYYAMIKCKTLHHASMPLSNVIPHLFPLVSPLSLYCRLSIKGAQLSKKKKLKIKQSLINSTILAQHLW